VSYPATGSPTQAVATAIRGTLTGDATLVALVAGVYGHLPAGRVDYPFIVVGRRSATDEAGAMQVAGSMVSVQIDVFHGKNATATTNTLGPGPVHEILSRIYVLLQRRDVTVTGFALIGGSMTRELEDVFDEPDDDAPEQRIYHGVQRWLCEVHEA
jgi:hypothetical protein